MARKLLLFIPDGVPLRNWGRLFGNLEGRVQSGEAHSFWSEFVNRAPFEPVRDIEYDEPESEAINHGRFHTMAGYGLVNQMTPSDADLFASLTNLCQRFDPDDGLLHTCTLDSMGHRFQHEESRDGARLLCDGRDACALYPPYPPLA